MTHERIPGNDVFQRVDSGKDFHRDFACYSKLILRVLENQYRLNISRVTYPYLYVLDSGNNEEDYNGCRISPSFIPGGFGRREMKIGIESFCCISFWRTFVLRYMFGKCERNGLKCVGDIMSYE